MSKRACVDANYVVGLFDDRDALHPAAREIQVLLEESGVQLLYLDCVITESLSALARRCRERKRASDFPPLLDQVTNRMPASRLTWTYPHVPRWYARCCEVMRESSGALNFRDALIVEVWESVGFDALVSFDRDFDAIFGMERLGSSADVRRWLSA